MQLIMINLLIKLFDEKFTDETISDKHTYKTNRDKYTNSCFMRIMKIYEKNY